MIPQNAIDLINEIKKTDKKLDKWEQGFISSVSIQAQQGRYLQPKQSAKLQEIYRKSQSGTIQYREYVG